MIRGKAKLSILSQPHQPKHETPTSDVICNENITDFPYLLRLFVLYKGCILLCIESISLAVYYMINACPNDWMKTKELPLYLSSFDTIALDALSCLHLERPFALVFSKQRYHTSWWFRLLYYLLGSCNKQIKVLPSFEEKWLKVCTSGPVSAHEKIWIYFSARFLSSRPLKSKLSMQHGTGFQVFLPLHFYGSWASLYFTAIGIFAAFNRPFSPRP